jgi:hypothetical protein
MPLCSSHNIQGTKRKVDTGQGASLSLEYVVYKAPLLAEQLTLQKPKGERPVLYTNGQENYIFRLFLTPWEAHVSTWLLN